MYVHNLYLICLQLNPKGIFDPLKFDYFLMIVGVILLVSLYSCAPEKSWMLKEGNLMTQWAKQVNPKNVHPEYPRPQMVRNEWMNLNGLWQIELMKEEKAPRFNRDLPETILVPFPIESALSGIQQRASHICYRKIFTIPDSWVNKRIWLHFGAVDWQSTVYVNQVNLGTHRGGYDAFRFDITNALKKEGDQELLVQVSDPTDQGVQPRGKQVRNPEGIWYTPATGIWQTVWLEPVADSGIDAITITPYIDQSIVEVDVKAFKSEPDLSVRFEIRAEGILVNRLETNSMAKVKLEVNNYRAWSPDDPYLYDLGIQMVKGGQVVDSIQTYFGMRKIAIERDDQGINRLFLNNKPLFQLGPLDQGFWPDGIYTAPTDEALKYDIEIMKKLGFNMVRKHVKIEPDRWYYWCDRLGLLVWQDMPSGDKYVKKGEGEITRSAESAGQFELELRRMIDSHFNHPSIITWVVFNEGWGQYDTGRLAEWVKKYDPTRLVNSASGWNDLKVGDVFDIHSYPGPEVPPVEEHRAAVLGEFGGLGLPVSGHTWQEEKNWGYRTYQNQQDLTAAYLELLKKLRPMKVNQGLSAAVYTQTTDVEIEVNGLMTYDRALIKMDEKAITEANRDIIK